jgi:hypothetical protein
MHCDYVAVPDSEVPSAALPAFQHVVSTHASEVNKTVSVWRPRSDWSCGGQGRVTPKVKAKRLVKIAKPTMAASPTS